jgi:hypothetical protein
LTTSDVHWPGIAVSGHIIHIVCSDAREGHEEIFYKRSTNDGTSWSADTRLSNQSATSYYPSIGVSDQVVQVVWSDIRNGSHQIFYNRSSDAGLNWGNDTQLTILPQGNYPSIAVSGVNVNVVWDDTRDGNDEIYYKCSTNGGTSWQSDVRLTNDPGYSVNPSIAIAGTGVHIVWGDERNSNTDVFYKRNPTGNVIEIKNLGTNLPEGFSLYQNYPNPFNPSTKIKFDIPSNVKSEKANVKLIIYNALGREITILVNEQLNPGTYEVEWDAGNFPSGVYFYKLEVCDFVQTKKMLLVK